MSRAAGALRAGDAASTARRRRRPLSRPPPVRGSRGARDSPEQYRADRPSEDGRRLCPPRAPPRAHRGRLPRRRRRSA